MLLQADANALEVRAVAFLSQDAVLMDELWNNKDIHTANQEMLGLPSRGVAKVFKFRTIYGGNEYSFANDPEFAEVSDKEKFWKDVLTTYFNKYKGMQEWHKQIVKQVIANRGVLEMPYGRSYRFQKQDRGYRDTQIKNFPVQGLGADLMAIARVSAYNRIKKLGYGDNCLFVNTVHDSIIIDINDKMCDTDKVVKILYQVFEDVPSNFEKLFGIEMNVPMKAEVQMGYNWKDMEVI